MKQVWLELSMSTQPLATQPTPAASTELISLMAAAISSVVKGENDEYFERSHNRACLDDSNQLDSPGYSPRSGKVRQLQSDEATILHLVT